MRQESNHRMNSSGKGNREISNSRAMGVITLIVLLFVFQVVTFTVHKIRERVYRTAEASGAGASSVEGVAGAGLSSSVGGGPAAAAGKAGAAVSGRRVAVGKKGEVRAPERFSFNPNTIGLDSLQRLGFTPRQAQSVLNYRNKGGRFRRKEDFARLYVVDSAMYASLEEYIEVPERESARPVPKRASEGGPVPETGHPVSGRAAESDAGRRMDTLYGRRVEGNRFICNLNTADSAELVRLYGIGGFYARKILDYRERLGGSFVSARQLLEIEGFSQERFSGIERSVEVKAEDVKGFSILDADRKALERHPYIGAYAARGILMYLEYKGRDAFKDNLQLLEQLVKERIISENNARRIREYLLHL